MWKSLLVEVPPRSARVAPTSPGGADFSAGVPLCDPLAKLSRETAVRARLVGDLPCAKMDGTPLWCIGLRFDGHSANVPLRALRWPCAARSAAQSGPRDGRESPPGRGSALRQDGRDFCGAASVEKLKRNITLNTFLYIHHRRCPSVRIPLVPLGMARSLRGASV